MPTLAELLAESLQALRDAKRFSHTSNSYRKDNPGEYEKVIAYLDGGERPTGVATAMGLHALLEEDTRRALDPVPSPAGKLRWAPPALTSPVTINVTNANSRPSLQEGKDYIIKITEKITADGGVCLQGKPRNVVLIGGEIFNSNLHTPPFDAWRQIGLYLPGVQGTAHVEGVYIHGKGVGDGLQTGTASNTATIQVQNCRIVTEHITQKTGAHPDAFQCYAGPAHWKMDCNTVISNGTIRTWQPMIYGAKIQSVDIRRQNWVAQQSKVEYGTYSIWDDLPSGQTWWSEHHEDLWFWVDTAHDSFHGLHRNTDAPNGFTPGQYGITGEQTKWGMRPEGDWVPAVMVEQGQYVSPGYL